MTNWTIGTGAEEASEQAEVVLARTVVVPFLMGMHMRPLSKVVNVARKYKANKIHIRRADRRISAMDMFDLLTLQAEKGTELVLECLAEPNGEEAMLALMRIFEEPEEETGSGSSTTHTPI